MRPRRAVISSSTAVLLELVAGHRTIRSICRATGLSSTSTVHKCLHDLRSRGLVDWEDGLMGTLHPLVRQVPFGVNPEEEHDSDTVGDRRGPPVVDPGRPSSSRAG